MRDKKEQIKNYIYNSILKSEKGDTKYRLVLEVYVEVHKFYPNS